MKPVLFFSHSSADNVRATALVQALEQACELKLAFDARDLAAGRTWREQLYRWITGCHGGVVLLTANVLDEPWWVLQEATLLRTRAAVEADAFRLFVVVDAPVLADARFKAIFGPLALDQLQRKKIIDVQQWEPELAGVVAAINAEMDKIAGFHNDYFSLLAELIFDELERLVTRDAVVRTLTGSYALVDAAWQALVEPKRAFRAMCARRLALGDFGGLGDIAGMFNALQGLGDAQERKALLGKLKSWWVPIANAQRLAEAQTTAAPALAGAPLRNVVLLQDDSRRPNDVAELHHERRFAPYRNKGTWLTVPAGEETALHFAQRTQRLLSGALFGEGDLRVPEAVVAQLALEHAAGEYTFVHASVSATAAHVSTAARTYWPCVFVLSVPSAYREDIERELGLGAVLPPPGAPPYQTYLDRLTRAEGYANK